MLINCNECFDSYHLHDVTLKPNPAQTNHIVLHCFHNTPVHSTGIVNQCVILHVRTSINVSFSMLGPCHTVNLALWTHKATWRQPTAVHITGVIFQTFSYVPKQIVNGLSSLIVVNKLPINYLVWHSLNRLHHGIMCNNTIIRFFRKYWEYFPVVQSVYRFSELHPIEMWWIIIYSMVIVNNSYFIIYWLFIVLFIDWIFLVLWSESLTICPWNLFYMFVCCLKVGNDVRF